MSEMPVMTKVDRGSARLRMLSNKKDRVVNWVMMGFCYACALAAITALFMIFGYILYKGFTSLSVSLFTELPGVPLEPGTEGFRPIGLRNCIAGTLVLIAMASTIGVPLGMLCGIYLAE